MASEVELKFLNINKQHINDLLTEIGAKKIYAHRLRSISFSAPGYSPRGANNKQFLRARQIGSDVYLTHKAPSISDAFKDREETEIVTNYSFEQAIAFLQAIGFTPELETNKFRTHYERGSDHFEIDEHEGLPPYLEIETTSQERMKSVCKELHLDYRHGKAETITYIYPEHFADK